VVCSKPPVDHDQYTWSLYNESKDCFDTFTWEELTEYALIGDDTKRNANFAEILIIRPNIEHNMHGIIMGRGGMADLGSTLWGQTELSCYDDSMHGIWGMSYKYNERAMVFNERNLIRMWDVAYEGYNGGKVY
jgi:hypothetical protein